MTAFNSGARARRAALAFTVLVIAITAAAAHDRGRRGAAGSPPLPGGAYVAALASGRRQAVLLVWLDAHAGTGWILAPPSAPRLTVAAGPGGTVRFSTDENGFLFHGRRGPEGIRGRILLGARAARVSYFGLGRRSLGRPIEILWRRLSTSRCAIRAGHYGDTRFSREAGEWTGADVILFGCGPGRAGVLTIYEGDVIGPALINVTGLGAGYLTFVSPGIAKDLGLGGARPQFRLQARGQGGVVLFSPAALGGAGAGEDLRYQGPPAAPPQLRP